MKLGYSHDVIVKETEDIKIDVTDANHIVIKGIDKQKVGQFAADVRNKRPPRAVQGQGHQVRLRAHPPQGRQDRCEIRGGALK